MRVRLSVATAFVGLLLSGTVLADHHFMMVVEVFPGTEAQPNAQYVVLQMYSFGQNAVNTHNVQVTDPNGTPVGTFTFAGNVGNPADQAKILIATPEAATLFNVTADLAMTPVLQRGGGRVCFNSSFLGTIDCVAWGGYTGPSTGVGTPIASGFGLRRGAAIHRRTDICGAVPGNLDACDDTNNSNADWVFGSPTPRNNAGTFGTTPPSTCGNGTLEGIEGCDDGDTSPGDGCNAARFLEQGADVPRELAVDTAGNGVLDPGETVVVAPTWRNVADATRNVDGDLISFTGPVGGTYSRTDMEAGYGMIAENDEAACGGTRGCFGVNVSVPAARPSLHWEASLLESTTSLTTMPWAIHIGNSFVDVAVASNPYYRFIETLFHNGVTAGCGGNLFCPGNAVTRQEMAVFLLVSDEGPLYQPPACVTPPFPDVPCSSPFAKWIQELVNRNVTAGCGAPGYCPFLPVTRDQMAVFLLLTLEGPGYEPSPCVTPTFPDMPCSNGFARWVEELVARGITAGCGGGLYCPFNPVTREQMAVFLTVNWGLHLYGP